MEKDQGAIQTQIEYYMSDKNLMKDKFFREQIQTHKEGYISISHFLNCKKVQSAGWTKDDIKKACAKSKELEVKGDSIRRAGNKPLPEKQAADTKKREQKAQDKAQEQQEDEYDKDGKVILVDKDYENPIIVSYEAKVDAKSEFKVDWKLVERKIKEEYPKLKCIYSRCDQHGGHLAFS